MSFSKFLVFLLIFVIAFSGCTTSAQMPPAVETATLAPAEAGLPTLSPTLTPFFQASDYPTQNWPDQPVLIASGDAIAPLIAWLPNGELLFWYEQGVKSGAYWLSPQGRAVYVDFSGNGAPVSGAAMGHAATLEQMPATGWQVRLISPGGALRTTHNLRIDKNQEEFPNRPELATQKANSLREAARFAGQALDFFACTAAQGATGEVRLTFDWACTSQAARLSKASDVSQWPVMLEPLSSSLALVCPGSPQGAAPIPFGQCIEEMADWAVTLVNAATQAQRQAERNAQATEVVLALTPATEAVEYWPGVAGTPGPTSTLGAPERLNAARDGSTATPSPVPTGVGVCGWLEALPGIWDLQGEAVKGDPVEIEFLADGSYLMRLYEWPEVLRGRVQCLKDGTLKLTFRQGYWITALHLAEDRLDLNLLTAIGFPASLQKESWQFNRRLD